MIADFIVMNDGSYHSLVWSGEAPLPWSRDHSEWGETHLEGNWLEIVEECLQAYKYENYATNG